MIRAFLKRTVTVALLLSILLVSYEIGTGRIENPIRARRTSLDTLTISVGERSVSIDLDMARQIGKECRRIGTELLSTVPAWIRLGGQAFRNAFRALSDALGIRIPDSWRFPDTGGVGCMAPSGSTAAISDASPAPFGRYDP